MRTALVTINTACITHNLCQVKALAPVSRVLAMVKANAYGHGVASCLPALQLADAIGVASFEEAKLARTLEWNKEIVLIEGVFSETEWQQALSHECQCVIHHPPQLDWALKHPPTPDSPCRTIWLKLNTGMNRLGFKPTDILSVAKRLITAGYELVLTSHFANADCKSHPDNQQQIQLFLATLMQLRRETGYVIKASLCNSAAIINFPEYHFDWVRPGIMLYGSSPISHLGAQDLNLQAAMRFNATLIAIDEIASGDSVGYGSRFIADRALTKGVISIGYGDGYPRVVDGVANTQAWVGLHHNNQIYPCPIIGRVSMDMTVIDISHVPSPVIGCSVTLWGNAALGEPSVDEVAQSANTIGYELLCRITQRPSRVTL